MSGLPSLIGTDTPLALYDRACKALAEAKSVDEVKDIRDQAMAMRLYAKQAKNKDLEADAFEIRLRAEARVGEMMAAQKETIGVAPAGRPSKEKGFSENPIIPTLADAGIDKNLAHRARMLNALPKAELERVISEGREAIERGVERQILRAVEVAEAKRNSFSPREPGGTVADLHALAASGKRFGAILADPPRHFQCWKSAFSDASVSGPRLPRTPDYATMKPEDIAAFPVGSLAADDCVLFMWTCWPMLFEVESVIKAWGFTYKTCGFSWMKVKAGQLDLDEVEATMGLGYWTRANTEVCLLATRGQPKRLSADIRQGIIEPRREHSRKPDCVHERIERLVAGPYLELFARRPRRGWTTWGDEIAREASALDFPSGAVKPARVGGDA